MPRLIDSASAETIPSGTTAAEEIVVGLYGRAFASATVTPDGQVADALTPSVLAMMGRDLAEYGESLWEIEVDSGALHLEHASDYTVEGLREWTYQLDHAYTRTASFPARSHPQEWSTSVTGSTVASFGRG